MICFWLFISEPIRKRILAQLVSALLMMVVAVPVFALDEEDPTVEESLAAQEEPDLLPFEEEEPLRVYDPLEPFNRGMFWVNDKLYFYLFKPVTRVYRVVPEQGRVSVANFFSNLATPVRLVNALLQLKFSDAGTEIARFLCNTTLGVGGIFDLAERNGLPGKEEDLGQTLGHYGVGPGFYLVLPGVGPTNLRDAIGSVGDGYLDPVHYLVAGTGEYIGVEAFRQINGLSLDPDTYEAIKREQLDPYLFIRNAYAQRRKGMIER